MTDQLDYVAKIRAKGCASTGITEDIAREMHSRKGAHYMAIVELKVDETHEKAEGQNKVDLVITQIELATERILDDHLRELHRDKYKNRALHSEDAQLQIETASDLEPSVEDIIAAREAAEAADRPHPFTDDGTGDCEICDGPKGNPIHAELEDPEDEDLSHQHPDEDTDAAEQQEPDPVPA
jgi:hypothetical protein